MERLILAIIAVICLHIAYVAYIYTDRPLVDTAWQPMRPAKQLHPVTGVEETFARIFPTGDIRSTLATDPDRKTRPGITKSVAARRGAPDPAGYIARRFDRYAPPVDPDDLSDRGPFKSVTIEIPTPYIPKMPVEPEPPAVKAIVQRTENRSFISTVFKKPYNWIKALGSKLK